MPAFFVALLAHETILAGNTWDGGGSNDDWGTGANWNENSSPTPGSGNDLYFAGTTRLTPNNNYATGDDWRSIYFAAEAGSFTVTGNLIDLYHKIQNNGTNLQKWNCEISFKGLGMEINPVEGDLELNGPKIYNNGNPINVYGVKGKVATVSGEITGSGGVTIHQNSVLLLSGTNTYTGGTNVNAGTLVVNGSLAAGNVSVKTGATLKGNGTIGGDVTFEDDATHAPGNSPGEQTVSGNLKYKTDSIFDWELVSNLDGDTGDAGDTGLAGTAYDAVKGSATKTLTVEDGAIFNIILNEGSSVNFSNTFWASNQKWTVFSGFQSVTGLFNLGTVTVDSVGNSFNTSRPGGSFSFSSSGGSLNLNWTAVPEPTTALAGILLGAGLWRRRR